MPGTDDAIFPEAEWETSSPEAQGVDGRMLHRALAYLARKSGAQGTEEAVVIKNGYLIWAGEGSNNRHDVWSCTKSFTSTVFGIMIDRGICSLDACITELLPQFPAQLSKLKLVDFATMTSGYDAGGHQSNEPFKPTQFLFEPGTKFCYWDSAMNQFANILSHIAGTTLKEIFRQSIADPIGIRSDQWDWGDFGNVDGILVNGGAGNKARGIQITPQQLARFGLLFLNGGKWGNRRLISKNWVEEATRVQVPVTLATHPPGAKGPGVYGYNWWVNGLKPDGGRLWEAAPPKTFAAKGFNNNICIVIPEWKMIIVRMGRDGNVDNKIYNKFIMKIKSSIKSHE